MRLFWSLFSVFIFNLCVDTVFRLVCNPLSNEKLVLVVVEIRALALSKIVDPVTFKVITITFGHHSVTVSFWLVPLAFIDTFVSVYHSTFALWHAIHPVTIVAISIFVEKGAATMFFVFEPIASILTSELLIFISPISSLTVTLVNWPHALILVSILVVLDTESFFAVIAPVSNVLLRREPLVSLKCAVFLGLLFLNPKNSSVGSVFLSFRIVTIQVVR